MKMKEFTAMILGLILVAGTYSQEQPWFNSDLDTDTRIAALIDAMTLDEKISQTVHNSASIERLEVSAYNRTNDEGCCGSNLLLEEILLGSGIFRDILSAIAGPCVIFMRSNKRWIRH
jgi:hypothetical protein